MKRILLRQEHCKKNVFFVFFFDIEDTRWDKGGAGNRHSGEDVAAKRERMFNVLSVHIFKHV